MHMHSCSVCCISQPDSSHRTTAGADTSHARFSSRIACIHNMQAACGGARCWARQRTSHLTVTPLLHDMQCTSVWYGKMFAPHTPWIPGSMHTPKPSQSQAQPSTVPCQRWYTSNRGRELGGPEIAMPRRSRGVTISLAWAPCQRWYTVKDTNKPAHKRHACMACTCHRFTIKSSEQQHDHMTPAPGTPQHHGTTAPHRTCMDVVAAQYGLEMPPRTPTLLPAYCPTLMPHAHSPGGRFPASPPP
jgi:hypothetical protein